jgi:1-phosphofructokinase
MYSKIQEICKDNNIRIVVDTTGESLTTTLRNKPFLIKPNNHELSEIFGVEIKSKEDAVYYGKKLVALGAENVIISMGGEGAALICKLGIYHAEAPKGTVRNSVGAGDSLIGGFIAEYSKNRNIIESFRWGVSAGSATAFSLDLCTKEDVERLLDKVNITKITNNRLMEELK